jgi:hypothetical protein
LPAIRAALKQGGRQRGIDTKAREIATSLRTEQLETTAPVTAAFAATTSAAVAIISELNRQIADLEAALAEHFETHPDSGIYRSQPGLGVVLGRRILRWDMTVSINEFRPHRDPRKGRMHYFVLKNARPASGQLVRF